MTVYDAEFEIARYIEKRASARWPQGHWNVWVFPTEQGNGIWVKVTNPDGESISRCLDLAQYEAAPSHEAFLDVELAPILNQPFYPVSTP